MGQEVRNERKRNFRVKTRYVEHLFHFLAGAHGNRGIDAGTVYWKCERGQTIRRVLQVPVINKTREDALAVAAQQVSLSELFCSSLVDTNVCVYLKVSTNVVLCVRSTEKLQSMFGIQFVLYENCRIRV